MAAGGWAEDLGGACISVREREVCCHYNIRVDCDHCMSSGQLKVKLVAT